jgi:Domain of unknown function (DUF4352)
MRGLIRAPLWLIGFLLMAAIFIGVYAYFTTPLPFGLGSIISTPGGTVVAPPLPTQTALAANARASAGQPLLLGAASVVVQAVARNQDLTTGGRGGPPGTFTVVDVVVQNAGGQPVTPQVSDFRLLDDRGRMFAVDPEATRSTNTFGHRRNLFDASVPPGGQVATFLAFETTPDSNVVSLRVAMGYGELDLPRPQ